MAFRPRTHNLVCAVHNADNRRSVFDNFYAPRIYRDCNYCRRDWCRQRAQRNYTYRIVAVNRSEDTPRTDCENRITIKFASAEGAIGYKIYRASSDGVALSLLHIAEGI